MLLRGTLLGEAKNGEAHLLLRFFGSNRGNGYSVPPRIPNGYPRQRPQVADQTSPQKPLNDFSISGDKPLISKNEQEISKRDCEELFS